MYNIIKYPKISTYELIYTYGQRQYLYTYFDS